LCKQNFKVYYPESSLIQNINRRKFEIDETFLVWKEILRKASSSLHGLHRWRLT